MSDAVVCTINMYFISTIACCTSLYLTYIDRGFQLVYYTVLQDTVYINIKLPERFLKKPLKCGKNQFYYNGIKKNETIGILKNYTELHGCSRHFYLLTILILNSKFGDNFPYCT